jgi:cell division protein FtsA
MALHTTISKAEDIKLEISKYKDDDIIEIPLIGDENDTKPTDIISIKEVMNARINETLLILNQLVEKSGFKDEIIGIVLTGGFTNLDGLRERAIELFGNNAVRIAKPKEMNGLFETLKAPEFSTAIGLILYSLGKHSSYEIDSNNVFRSKYSIEDTTKEIEDNSPEMVVIEDNNEKNTQSSPIQKAIMWFKNLF